MEVGNFKYAKWARVRNDFAPAHPRAWSVKSDTPPLSSHHFRHHQSSKINSTLHFSQLPINLHFPINQPKSLRLLQSTQPLHIPTSTLLCSQ